MTSGRRSALGPMSTDRSRVSSSSERYRLRSLSSRKRFTLRQGFEIDNPWSIANEKTFESNSNSRLTVEGARSPPRAVLVARRSRLYFSIRIGEISSIGLLPSALISGRERNSSCTHVRLLILDQGRKVSVMKSRSNGAGVFCLPYVPSYT